MQTSAERSLWDLTHVIGLLHTLSPHQDGHGGTATTYELSIPPQHDQIASHGDENADLGNFSRVFDYLKTSSGANGPHQNANGDDESHLLRSSLDQEKGVKWRDEVDGADLEDNAELRSSDANLRTKDRAARRAKARLRKKELAAQEAGVERPPLETDTGSGSESDTKKQLSPTILAARRRAIIQQQTAPKQVDGPQNLAGLHVTKHVWPVSDPFSYRADTKSTFKGDIWPLDDQTPDARRQDLIMNLQISFPYERKYLQHASFTEPSLSIQNVADEGIHVFIDISNIMIGFHEILKSNRNMDSDQKVHRVPFDFSNLSLVLERGRPAAKRVLVGSDNFPHIEQARNLGYETNILERVHKAKALKQKPVNGVNCASTTPAKVKAGYTTGPLTAVSSGSDTNTPTMGPAKWVEQAVDEILHLKILESVVDTDEPGRTMVLATGDASIAEYSDGFLRMVERALKKGWTVELASFSKGMSGLYKRGEFKRKWGPRFSVVALDKWGEWFLDVDTIRERKRKY